MDLRSTNVDLCDIICSRWHKNIYFTKSKYQDLKNVYFGFYLHFFSQTQQMCSNVPTSQTVVAERNHLISVWGHVFFSQHFLKVCVARARLTSCASTSGSCRCHCPAAVLLPLGDGCVTAVFFTTSTLVMLVMHLDAGGGVRTQMPNSTIHGSNTEVLLKKNLSTN